MSLTHVIISEDRKTLRRVRYMEAPNVTTSRAKPLELPQTLSAYLPPRSSPIPTLRSRQRSKRASVRVSSANPSPRATSNST